MDYILDSPQNCTYFLDIILSNEWLDSLSFVEKDGGWVGGGGGWGGLLQTSMPLEREVITEKGFV